MRPLALVLSVFWPLQVLVCLSPGAGESAHVQSTVGHHDADGEGVPHSHAPGSNHHQGSDGGCAQHCASLSQTVVASPAAVPAPTLVSVVIAPLAASVGLPRTGARALAQLELGRPPPDLLARHSTLRI